MSSSTDGIKNSTSDESSSSVSSQSFSSSSPAPPKHKHGHSHNNHHSPKNAAQNERKSGGIDKKAEDADAKKDEIKNSKKGGKDKKSSSSDSKDDVNKFDKKSVWAKISINGENTKYPGQKGNEVRTTRYRWYTFIPLTLFEQYRVLSNIYYIFVLIVSFLPTAPINYLFQLVPMIVVLIVSMAKAGIEDLLKYFEDKKRNFAPALVYRNGQFVQVKAADICVGDIVKITDDMMVPADLLFIGSSQESGLCYYSETNLNGETAVKTMQTHPAFEGKNAVDLISRNHYSIEAGEPDRDLTRFDARLRCGSQYWPITINNVLLSGVCTHYTDNILGVAIRTGHDTKIMQNVKMPPAKMTQFDRNLNRMLIVVFIFKMIFCFVSTFVGVSMDNGERFPLMKELYPGYGTSFLEFFTQYFVLYSYLFPISLLVTIEIVRLFHKIVISHDPELYDPEFGYGRAHNSNIICQLGLVTHILTDKTGTLTENQMELLKFATYAGTFNAREFLDSIEADPSLATANLPILMAMAICNNIIVHKKSDGKLEYNADSPDEAAFVAFAAKCGVRLISRGITSLTVDVRGKPQTFDILAQLPFNSDRKRMSIIVKSGDQPAIIYTKGADNVMAERTTTFEYQDTVNDFAATGLRTLVFASREIKDEELTPWMKSYHEAEAALENRDERLFEIAGLIENGLYSIGVSGVEDRLQAEVPETIRWIRDAGIKLWVLTGDKLETAIAIGKTSGVIDPKSEMMIVSTTEPNAVGHKLEALLGSVSSFESPVLIITADAVEHAIHLYQDKFMKLADQCDSVILSRVSPFMKAHVTQVVKEAGRSTLGIGDGANDVGMIQVADMGIGVYGREGSQAAMSSDFAIPRFRHLRRCLMVHGHWTYRRFAFVAISMVYKNIVFIFAQLWFAFDNLWSPTAFYNGFLMSCFNLVFTALCPLIMGFWEQDLPQDVLLANPILYQPEFDPMSTWNLIYYLWLGVYQSVTCYYGPRLTMQDYSLNEIGTWVYLAMLYTVIIQFIMWMENQNTGTYIVWGINIILAPIIIVAYFYLFDPAFTSVVTVTMGQANPWMTFLISLFASVFVPFLISYTRERFFPTIHRIYRERHYLNKRGKGPRHWVKPKEESSEDEESPYTTQSSRLSSSEL
ncbi:putative phospholipid-transporting ATPase [Tritrichomonas foetus]|uniref:Phospholipid-transporting ATPase n=1 Tax=Tritrichomonas foetus TaxID=1144522 RepID=A0A1J4KAD9_9EUKA|nr:putative phospholipid-transporting ATPase [Tritrichomonas foetus]|eukprot:OHT06421.1 putative phospholipid-transporting ATPase [Tritrichomonas foetus]